MQNENLNDTSKILGFRIGAKVRVTKRFFDNHQIKYVDLGTGEVIGKQMSDNQLPKILITMVFHSEMYTNNKLRELILPVNMSKSHVVVIAIHPLYLEKVEEKKKRGKKIRTSA